jgi:hypothetical protein
MCFSPEIHLLAAYYYVSARAFRFTGFLLMLARAMTEATIQPSHRCIVCGDVDAPDVVDYGARAVAIRDTIT